MLLLCLFWLFLTLTHLHVLVTITVSLHQFLFLLIFRTTTFSLKVLTTCIRSYIIFFGSSGGSISISHFSIAFRICSFGSHYDLLLFLLVVFFCTICSLVVSSNIGLWLIRRVLWGCSSFRVPFDGKARDSGLLSQDVTANLVDDGLRRGVLC
jgi:hypothetical protein